MEAQEYGYIQEFKNFEKKKTKNKVFIINYRKLFVQNQKYFHEK